MPESMNDFLDSTVQVLCQFLDNELPRITDDWWERRVLPALSEQQQAAVVRNRTTQLSGLDMAALLRVLDDNFRLIDELHGRTFTQGALNYIKEMMVVRHRWIGHRSAVPNYPPADIYRDFDTLERLLDIVSAPTHLLDAVRDSRINAAKAVLEAGEASQPEVIHQTPDGTEASVPDSPSCPVCGNSMVRRTARSGPHAGNSFWGCSQWASNGCGGIVNIDAARPDAASRNGSEQPLSPRCPSCDSEMVRRTARAGPYAGNPFWGCSQWSITGCGGLINIQQTTELEVVDDLPV